MTFFGPQSLLLLYENVNTNCFGLFATHFFTVYLEDNAIYWLQFRSHKDVLTSEYPLKNLPIFWAVVAWFLVQTFSTTKFTDEYKKTFSKIFFFVQKFQYGFENFISSEFEIGISFNFFQRLLRPSKFRLFSTRKKDTVLKTHMTHKTFVFVQLII